MNRFAPVDLPRRLAWLAGLIIVLVPFHAFLTVWLSSLTGHYTLLRLWKEFLLILIALGSLYVLFRDRNLLKKFFGLRLVQLIFVYFAVLLVCGLSAWLTHNVSAKAMWYGLLVDSRFLIFFLAVLIIAVKDKPLKDSWQKLLLIPALAVAAVAILQFLVLPYDFMKHFGYNQSTIFPYGTINHNIHHLRVMSTLRGANPLGAYMIVPISALAVFTIKENRQRRDKLMFGAGLVLALLFSFSRSAWLGAALAVVLIAFLAIKSPKLQRQFTWVALAIVVVALAAGLVLRNNTSFQDAVLHTDSKSTVKTSSNQGHSSAFKSAVKDIWHHPLGSGVGTAGPQSVYNNQAARIAENYFLQIGQEAGLIGMALFVAICAALGKMLFARRSDPLALALFASLIGLSFVNLLSHAWSDDTLAYVFWGLAGMALAPLLKAAPTRKNT